MFIFGFLMALFLRYHGRPRQEARVAMHVLVSKEKTLFCQTSKKNSIVSSKIILNAGKHIRIEMV